MAERIDIEFGYVLSPGKDDGVELTDAARARMEKLTEASHAHEDAQKAAADGTPQAS